MSYCRDTGAGAVPPPGLGADLRSGRADRRATLTPRPRPRPALPGADERPFVCASARRRRRIPESAAVSRCFLGKLPARCEMLVATVTGENLRFIRYFTSGKSCVHLAAASVSWRARQECKGAKLGWWRHLGVRYCQFRSEFRP